MLVLLAGNEVGKEKLWSKDLDKFCVTDNQESYIKRYNPFATVIGNSHAIKTDLSSVIIPGLFEPPVRTLRATIPENESRIFR